MCGQHFYFLCGLPKESASKVTSALGRKFPHLTFRQLAARRESPKYTERYISTILSNLVSYVSKAQDLPRSLSLVIVDDVEKDRLYDAFFPFANLLLCKIDKLYDADACIEKISALINKNKQRDERGFLFLPIYNFKLEEKTVENLFKGIFWRDISVGEIESEFSSKKYTSDTLPSMLSAKQKKYFYTDKRGLVFPPCKPTEQHGRLYLDEKTKSDKLSPGTSNFYLSAFYRFGFLKGSGFHYDVQFPCGKQIKNEEFFCQRKKEIIKCTAADHINVYLNDAIRC